jgi:hypothetical protein
MGRGVRIGGVINLSVGFHRHRRHSVIRPAVVVLLVVGDEGLKAVPHEKVDDGLHGSTPDGRRVEVSHLFEEKMFDFQIRETP